MSLQPVSKGNRYAETEYENHTDGGGTDQGDGARSCVRWDRFGRHRDFDCLCRGRASYAVDLTGDCSQRIDDSVTDERAPSLSRCVCRRFDSFDDLGRIEFGPVGADERCNCCNKRRRKAGALNGGDVSLVVHGAVDKSCAGR